MARPTAISRTRGFVSVIILIAILAVVLLSLIHI